MVNRKLGRKAGHRAALFRNQLSSLISSERIITTLPKAKELRPQIERLVTLAKTDNVHNRRQAGRSIADDTLVAKLFDTIGPRFNERPGGYTRIVKLGPRRGDAAEMAILEFVGFELGGDTKKAAPAAGASKGGSKKAAAPATTEDEDEAPKKRSRKAAAPEADASGDDKPKRSRKKKEE
jgi:large subunit ribosomal protein L17